MVDSAALSALQAQLGYQFKDMGLLDRALTHRSFASQHNERLEFLGDGLLNLVAAEMLYTHYPLADEGQLSRMRSHLVRQDCLARLGEQLQLSELIRLGEGERKSGGAQRPSLVADVVEALFGAVYQDGGFQAGRSTIEKLLAPVLAQTNEDALGKDAKTRLQEWLQGQHKSLPVYAVVQEGGTNITPDFIVECRIEDPAVITRGQGASRRAAEQQSAQTALAAIEHGHMTTRTGAVRKHSRKGSSA